MTLKELLARLDACIGPVCPKALTEYLNRLSALPEEMAPFLRFDAGHYRRNLVQETATYELKLLCWLKGQETPIHDHRGSACGVLVYRGIARETRYEITKNAVPSALESRLLTPGLVTASFDRDAHRITALTDLVSVHVYSPPLKAMTVYPDPRKRQAHTHG